MIRNKHKFFSAFEEQVEEVVAEEEYLMDEELVFRAEKEEEKARIAEKMKEKVKEYREKVELFSERKEGFKRGISFTSTQDLAPARGDELELFIPKIKGNEDKIVQNTLFFNKMKNHKFHDVRSSPLLFKKQSSSYTREEYQRIVKEQIKGKKKENIAELLKKFQKTSFDQIEDKKKKMQQHAHDDMSSDDEEVKFDDAQLNKLSSEDVSEVECIDNEDYAKEGKEEEEE